MKVEFIDPLQRHQVSRSGQIYAIDAILPLAGGALYFGRPWVNSDRYSYFESLLLPHLGVQACTYTAIPPATAPWDWYVDVARITVQDGTFRIHDLYLDLGVHEGRGYDILDLDEFAEALKQGAIVPADADYALRSLHRLTQCLAGQGYFMERVLCAQLGLDRLPLRGNAGT